VAPTRGGIGLSLGFAAGRNDLTIRHNKRLMITRNLQRKQPMVEAPREVFRQMLTALSTTPYRDLSLTERGSWLPADVREAIANGWVVADGPNEGMFGQPVHITEKGRSALVALPYPPFQRRPPIRG
jgi:hypothetical protein